MEHNLPDEMKEIQSIHLYNIRPTYMHGYVAPFIAFYIGWLFFFISTFGFNDYPEAGYIGFAVIGCLQILTCLFCHWFVTVRCFLTCKKATSLESATVALIHPMPNNGYADLVKLVHTKSSISNTDVSSFEFQKIHYTYSCDKGDFVAAKFPIDLTTKEYSQSKGHQSELDLKIALEKYGVNDTQMDIPKFSELFVERATAPFFVFQVFCVALWCLDEYWYYSVFTLFMLIVFECTLVQQQLKNMAEIRKMGNKPYLTNTYRNKKWTMLMTDQLVPGDIISVSRSRRDQLIPCDILLMRGSCIVDESMLTGESVPVMKESIEEVDSMKRFSMETDSKLHVLFAGTKIVQHTAPSKATNELKAPDNGCIAYVIRTSFSTAQGRLLKTILYSVKRVTANNLETFLFILFLLVFAIIAASYVWIKGTEDPKRNRYKLFLECTLILTSVVPPELPIELSLAVNSSLVALSKFFVYCTEPFRIPFAGKIDVCCFDKTGTLTKDEMVVEGVAGIGEGGSPEIISVHDCPLETIQVMASCHSLINIDRDLIGDPLEKAMLNSIEWTLTKGEAAMPRVGLKTYPLKIFQRFHFSSALQRMSVIAGFTPMGSVDNSYIVCVKGSPEALKPRFSDAPADYDQVYLEMARQGARVLALGHKKLGKLSHQEVRELKREKVESELKFCGFVIISCPLKGDSKTAIKEILTSSHHVIIITGDNPLTGCHVSKQLKITRKKHILVLQAPNKFDTAWHWQSVDDSIILPWKPPGGMRELASEYDLCMTGDGFTFLKSEDKKWLMRVIPAVKVFARVSPKQKENVVTALKSLGYFTLMCGDGTNDVGALKHAHVGVALLANAPELLSIDSSNNSSVNTAPAATTPLNSNGPSSTNKASRRKNGQSLNRTPATQNQPAQLAHENPGLAATDKRLKEMMAQMEEEEKAQIVRLGDASVAAPFTVRHSSVTGVCHIIKQGRCTLVTTLQMFKILALNALILAYSQSVLFLEGVKFSDAQATIQALLLAGCFLFISRSKPLKYLSKQRPLPNIFNAYTLLTVMLQFSVHFASVYHLTILAKEKQPVEVDERGFVDIHQEFKPTLLNSLIYLISIGMQVTTFAVNYKGHPFMESVFENRPLFYSLMGAGGAVAMLASGVMPEASEYFKIVDIPDDIRPTIMIVLFLDYVTCLLIDRVLDFFMGKGRVKRVA